MSSSSLIGGRLSKAWAFLCGESRAFVEVAPPAVTAIGSRDASALLPVTLGDSTEGACRVVISAEQARQVASFLFGVGEQELSPADLQDAVLEACNVLGSCLVQSIADADRISIGCPEIDGRAVAELVTQSQYRPEALAGPRLDLLAQRPLCRDDGELP